MKEAPLETLINSMPGGKELRGDSGIRSVDALHNLAVLVKGGEDIQIKFPLLNKVFDQATSDLNRNNNRDPELWKKLFDAAYALLPENHAKQKRLDSLRKHLPASPDGTI